MTKGASWRDRIVKDPLILAGKPTVKGTRISVELIVEKRSRHHSQVFAHYPGRHPGVSGIRRHRREVVQRDLAGH